MNNNKTINFKYNIGDVVYYISNRKIIKGNVLSRTYSETTLNPPEEISYRVPPESGGLNLHMGESKLYGSLSDVVNHFPITDRTK